MTWSTKILPFVTRAAALSPPSEDIALEVFPRFQREWSRPAMMPRAVRGFSVPPKVGR